VLLCYEALDHIEPDQQKYACHRRALSEWLELETGQPVPELSD
jgi:hypothetical protein